ncbi:nuclease-related domain-containing DEAD/DEAH box helicase [Acinetobacter lactucae]|uniref:nuclease-related domain-containing DEAD/DEAH box helicase n=1 Tax=Acinetobacter lactucae TaxID=1785128 RepID=UPI00077E1B7D|nr:NERD domain-containing protein [Acinetobacter lactucae]
MPKMIPRVLYSDNTSPGEIDFFERISTDININNWVVMHSLNIAYHQTRLMGELDFIVIIPQLGILVIEVKAHRNIKFENGIWYLGKHDIKGSLSPFVQLNKAMFSLQKYIANSDPYLKTIPIFPLVIFTHCEIQPKSIEINKNNFISCKEYRESKLSKLLEARIKKYREEASNKESLSWLSLNSTRPNSSDISRLIKVLRPNIEPIMLAESYSSIIEKELIKFTSEQYDAIDSLADHSCVLFSGAPGTGKTFIAIESAIRSAKEGKKILFVCMNKLLGDFLKRRLLDWHNITVNTFHALIRSYDFDTYLMDENNSNYWTEILPEIAYTKILENSLDSKYDLLIVDEAQDIIGNNLWLDCLDLLLKKGLTQGCWHFFGDFIHQNIYSKKLSENDFLALLKKRNSDFVHFQLKKNCRNIEVSVRHNLNLIAIDSPYLSYLRKSSPILDSKFYIYSNNLEQITKLNSIIQNCLKEGFKYSDIVILSKCAEFKGLVHQNINQLKANIYDLDLDCLRYTSIYKFKGLEAPVIILTDFDEIESNEAKNLLFTGASRATDSVHYLFHKSVQNTLFSYLKGNKS